LDEALISDINTLLKQYRGFMDETKLRDGISTAMSLSKRGNQYLQDSDLHKLAINDPERSAEVILNAINLVYLLTVMIHPFMPAISSEFLQQLNAPPRSLPEVFSVDILPGHKVGKAEFMFELILNVDGAQERAWQQREFYHLECIYWSEADHSSGQTLKRQHHSRWCI
jgi:methionyl-tRNA synthetase